MASRSATPPMYSIGNLGSQRLLISSGSQNLWTVCLWTAVAEGAPEDVLTEALLRDVFHVEARVEA